MKGKSEAMNLYFDTEFTGLRKNTTLVSIGVVADDGKKFYAEFTDFDEKQCDQWIEDNVLKHLILNGNDNLDARLGEGENTTVVLGCKDDIKNELADWISQFESVQFVSDVCHYDFVLLIDLFGTAWDFPKNVSAYCHDINQDIARHYGISEKDAFDMSREDIVFELYQRVIDGSKHNALYDAEVIRAIYRKIAI